MRDRDPWPMWPFGLAIVLFIGVYTFINLQFRKEGPAFEPFQEMMDRKIAVVEKNMYDWYGLTTIRSDDKLPLEQTAEVRSQVYENVLDEIVPEQLKYYMPGRPILLPGFVKIESPETITPGEHARLRLHVPAGIAQDERLNLLAFYKEGDLYLLPTLFVESLDLIDPALLAGKPTPISYEMPTAPIEGDVVKAHLLTEGRLAQWEIEVEAPQQASP